jgi:hypothetical protein
LPESPTVESVLEAASLSEEVSDGLLVEPQPRKTSVAAEAAKKKTARMRDPFFGHIESTRGAQMQTGI